MATGRSSKTYIFPEHGYKIKNDQMARIRQVIDYFWSINKIIFYCVFTFKLIMLSDQTIWVVKESIKNVDKAMEAVATFPAVILATVKLYTMTIKRENVTFVSTAIQNQFWDIDIVDRKTQERLKLRFNFLNQSIAIFTFNATLVTLMYICFPVLSLPEGRTRHLPSIIVLPFDTDPSPVHEIVYGIMSGAICITTLGNALYDYTLTYMDMHITAQLIMLSELIKNITSGVMENLDDLGRFKSKEFQNIMKKRIKIWTEHHNLVLKCARLLDDYSSWVSGVQIISTYLLGVLCGYMILQAESFYQALVTFILVMLGVLEFIIYTLLSSDLFEMTTNISDSIYQSNWYLFQNDMKKSLIMIYRSSKDGIVLKGLSLIEMKNSLLIDMGQKIFNSLAVLLSLQQENAKNQN